MKGFTLLEIVIATGIGLLVGLLLVGIMVNHNGFFYKQNAVINEGVALNDVLNKLNENIRQSAQIATEYPKDSPTYHTDQNTLILKLPSINNEILIENTFDYIVISKDTVSPNILRMQTFPDPLSTRKSVSQVLTTILKTISFKYLDKAGQQVSPLLATSVETTITLLTKTGSISSEKTATTLTNLRNLN